ncbi:hypothetical protein [Geosporobacter ferrireducens]|uniref:hypothetical protein n=1 Tax=Geosporobacter ferrireducens TaxID=1424294 RepID=UPI00139E1874|nr:hypothetical protein [Geosporobacter ferrireducens]MTI53809.1 hypothetical protein [Geosporobacter ferrireducens]
MNGSKLLLDEQPLVLLPQLAIVVGLNEAIVLQQINYWIRLKEKAQAKDCYKDGYYWVYNSYGDWRTQFPFWSTKTIQRTIRNLESLGILISTDRYNVKKYDKTKWYRIDYILLDALEKKNEKKVSLEEKTSIENKNAKAIENTHEDKLSSGETIGNAHEDKLSLSNRTTCPHGVGQSVLTNTRDYTEITTDIFIVPSVSPKEKNPDRRTEDKELERIFLSCEFDHLKRYSTYSDLIDAVKQAVVDMYFAKELKVQQRWIPGKAVKEALIKLKPYIIEYALDKYREASQRERIKSPKSYLQSCIYNAVSECTLGVYAEVSYDLHNGYF